MTSTTQLPDNSNSTINIGNEFKEINAHLNNISTREVLVIVAICLLGVVTAVNLLLAILQYRKKYKHDGIPQSIVIKPNGSNGKSVKTDSANLSMENKDVLPSKSMKMKVAITPGSFSNRKSKSEKDRLPKEGGSADTSYSKVETVGSSSASQSSKKEKDATNSNSLDTLHNNPDQSAVDPKDQKAFCVSPSQSRKSVNDPKLQENVVMNVSLTSDAPSLSGAVVPPHPSGNGDDKNSVIVVPTGKKSKTSASTDSMTSFTVPEENRTTVTSPASKNDGVVASQPSTPSATTLSGSKAGSSISNQLLAISPKVSKEENKIVAIPPSPNPATVPASAINLKSTNSPNQLTTPNILKTPSKQVQPDQKVQSYFPNGCGTGV